MWPNPHFAADLVTFTEEILNGKLHFLCSATGISKINNSFLRIFFFLFNVLSEKLINFASKEHFLKNVFLWEWDFVCMRNYETIYYVTSLNTISINIYICDLTHVFGIVVLFLKLVQFNSRAQTDNFFPALLII